ncbi:MAG: mechanosensitive ion channel family protein [Spirochaetaceae bacterium]|jgi:small-conductance mechanosensitive channel|nr:mechanosensitive ion channel family protein [Spirochaetaceae bacterium]
MRLRHIQCGLFLILWGALFSFGISAQDTQAEDKTLQEEIAPVISESEAELEALTRDIGDAVEEKSENIGLVQRLGIAAAIIIGQILLIRLVWLLFKLFERKVRQYGQTKFKPLKVKSYRLLDTKQLLEIISFFLKIIKYLVTLLQLIITVPIVFSLFPLTERLAGRIFGYILTPLKNIAWGMINYIPNLFTIIIIITVTRYVTRSLRFFATQISRGKLVLPGFYADWAQPTFNILRILLYAFTVAIIYPYLPGSDSAIFQGVSVFVGIIFSLGSTSAIGNLVAGVVITYMRPFKIGDRIKLNDVTGFVVEKSPIVIRVKTAKNEYVTFPNMMILNSSVVNYHTSSDENEEGLILYTTVTFGYNTPWQTVEAILIEAALKTIHVQKEPRPFVLQTALDDFYANYQINLYTKNIEAISAIYSDLNKNIQDGFRAAGLDMTAPHFRTTLPPPPLPGGPEGLGPSGGG